MENMNKKRKFSKKKLAVLAAIGVIGVGGAIGASAFFTDKDSFTETVNAGTLNMKVTNLSDLDGNYGVWSENAGNPVLGFKQNATFTAGKQTSTINKGTILVNGSGDKIINPGDTGLLAYTISNTAEKSMDVARVTGVTVTLSDNQNITKDDIELNDDDNTVKTAPYAIEDAMGTSAVAFDASGNQITKDTVENLSTNSITLVYAKAGDVLSGTVETESDDSKAVTYAYRVLFDRLATNKFQDATFKVVTDVYAKQHRNTFSNTFTVKNDGTATLATNNDGSNNLSSVISADEDWSEISSFENVVD